MNWADYGFPDNIKLRHPYMPILGLYTAIQEKYAMCNISYPIPENIKLTSKETYRFFWVNSHAKNTIKTIYDQVNELFGGWGGSLFVNQFNPPNAWTKADALAYLGEEEKIIPYMTQTDGKPLFSYAFFMQQYRLLNLLTTPMS